MKQKYSPISWLISILWYLMVLMILYKVLFLGQFSFFNGFFLGAFVVMTTIEICAVLAMRAEKDD